MFTYHSLIDVDYQQITECFNLAFSDYLIPMQLTSDQLICHLSLSGFDKKQSFGAFSNGEMIGCIFNGYAAYQGRNAAFNIGTGIINEYRGKGVFKALLQFCEAKLIDNGIECYYLEVLQNNFKAIEIYQHLGFKIVSNFIILNANFVTKEVIKPIQIIEYKDFVESNTIKKLKTSFEHSDMIVKMHPEKYYVIYVETYENISALMVIDKNAGSIVQMAYSQIDAFSILIDGLLSKYKNVTLKNIDSSYFEIIKLFKAHGFNEVAKQFEMVKYFKN